MFYYKYFYVILTLSVLVCSTRTKLTPRGEESSERVLFLDESTLSIDTAFELDLYETGISITSSFLKDNLDEQEKEYVVVGTAFVLPEESQPTRGRILVFEIITTSIANEIHRQITLVVEIQTRGVAYTLATLKGRLVAGIDSKVIIFIFIKISNLNSIIFN